MYFMILIRIRHLYTHTRCFFICNFCLRWKFMALTDFGLLGGCAYLYKPSRVDICTNFDLFDRIQDIHTAFILCYFFVSCSSLFFEQLTTREWKIKALILRFGREMFSGCVFFTVEGSTIGGWISLSLCVKKDSTSTTGK